MRAFPFFFAVSVALIGVRAGALPGAQAAELAAPAATAAAASDALPPDTAGEAERLIAAGQSSLALDLLLPLEPQLAGQADYDYLLGLAALQSGQYTLAISALERVTLVQPGHAGAWLDLALAHQRVGDAQSARLLIRHVQASFAANAGQTRRLAALQDALRADRLLRGWSGEVTLLGGAVSNANLGIGSAGFSLTSGGIDIPVRVDAKDRPRGDAALQLRGQAQRLFAHEGGASTQVLLSGRSRSFASESDYDFADLLLLASHLRPWAGGGERAWQTGVYLRNLRFGGAPLAWFGGVQGGLRWPAGRCTLGAGVELERREYVAVGQFSASIGWLTGQADCTLSPDHQLSVALRAGYDEPDSARPGGSMQRYELSAAWRWRIGPRITLDALAYSAYNQDRRGFSPLLESNATRNVTRTGQRLSLQWAQPFGLAAPWTALLELENLRDDSNLPLFVYTDRQIFAGVRYAF